MFKGNLYETQKEAAGFLVNKKKVLLAWEQGSGKTIISISAAEKLFELGRARNCLILAPTSICWQWQEKIMDFSDSKSHLVTAGSPESRKRAYLEVSERAQYTIVPYSLFRNDFDDIAKCKFDIIICDEAQEFKNNASKTARLLKDYNRRVPTTGYRWALTGTAISNRLEELYSIFFWIDKTFLPSWPTFESQHIVRSPYTNAIIKYKNLKGLHEHLRHKMDRKTHKDLEGELPALVHQYYSVSKSSEYAAAELQLITALDDMAEELRFNEEGGLIKPSPEVSRAFAAIQSAVYKPKLRELKRLIDNTEDNMVIFSRHKEPLYQLREHYGNDSVLFTGDQSSVEKQKAIKQFTVDSRLLLCSDAGNSGLDLPGANHVAHLNIPFSWSVLDQRNKRITRLSSTFETVVAHYLLVADSIEHYFYNQVIRKGQLASAALEGTADEVIVKPQSLRQFLNGKDTGILQTQAAT